MQTKVYTKDECPKGYNSVFCDLCAKVTLHTKGLSTKEATCTNHCDWTKGVLHIVSSHIVRPDPSRVSPPEAELRRMNRMDQSFYRKIEERKRDTEAQITPEWAQDIFTDSNEQGEEQEDNIEVQDPDKLYCSFCGAEVQRINTLTEKRAAIIKYNEFYKDSSGDIVSQQKRRVSVTEMRACPKCVLFVKNPQIVRTV